MSFLPATHEHLGVDTKVEANESCPGCLNSFLGEWKSLFKKPISQLLAVMVRGCPHIDRQCHFRCLRILGLASRCPGKAQVSHNWPPSANISDNPRHLKWHGISMWGQLKRAHISLNLELYLTCSVMWILSFMSLLRSIFYKYSVIQYQESMQRRGHPFSVLCVQHSHSVLKMSM